VLRERGDDLGALRGDRSHERGADHRGVLAEHAPAAAEAGLAIALAERGEDRGEGIGMLVRTDERVREQAMAGQVIRAIGDGAAERVDRERVRESRESFAGEPAQVGAAGNRSMIEP
jgi:hypothetical protein